MSFLSILLFIGSFLNGFFDLFGILLLLRLILDGGRCRLLWLFFGHGLLSLGLLGLLVFFVFLVLLCLAVDVLSFEFGVSELFTHFLLQVRKRQSLGKLLFAACREVAEVLVDLFRDGGGEGELSTV